MLPVWMLFGQQFRTQTVDLSACSGVLSGHGDHRLLAPVGIGALLIAGGVERVIGALWPVSDIASLLFRHFLYAETDPAQDWG